jgi:hypothetical protein
MTTFDGVDEEIESRFGVGWTFSDILAVGRWVNPLPWGLGALALGGYLLTADLATSVAGPPAPVSGAQIAPSMLVPAQLALGSNTAIVSHSGPARDESVRTSTLDLLKAVFGAVIAFAWAMIGAWLGVRRARSLTPVNEPGYDGSAATDSTARSAFDPPRGPTCQRMYDETRLVPQYLRCAEFPAMKQDLLQLAEVHADEGRALRRLEQLPDRRYSSLHDLVTEIHID